MAEHIQGILFGCEEKHPVIFFSGALIELQVLIQNEMSWAQKAKYYALLLKRRN